MTDQGDLIIGLHCPNEGYHIVESYQTVEAPRGVWTCDGCGCKFETYTKVGIVLLDDPDSARVKGGALTIKHQLIQVFYMTAIEWKLHAEIQAWIVRLSVEWGLITEAEGVSGFHSLAVAWGIQDRVEGPPLDPKT